MGGFWWSERRDRERRLGKTRGLDLAIELGFWREFGDCYRREPPLFFFLSGSVARLERVISRRSEEKSKAVRIFAYGDRYPITQYYIGPGRISFSRWALRRDVTSFSRPWGEVDKEIYTNM